LPIEFVKLARRRLLEIVIRLGRIVSRKTRVLTLVIVKGFVAQTMRAGERDGRPKDVRQLLRFVLSLR
jgi:hypothetical protein